MASLKRKHTKNGFKKSKKSRKESKKSFRKSKSSLRRITDKGDATNIVATWNKKIGKKVSKEGRGKKVKVSRELRKKIKKVINQNVFQGWFKEIYYPSTPIGFLDSEQQSVYLGTGQPSASGINGYVAFNPLTVLNAASRLWNSKAKPALAGGGSFADANNFNPENVKIEVVESNVVYRLKNNSARTLHIKIFDVSPKSANSQSTGMDPLNYWQNNLGNETPSSGNMGPNVSAATIRTLGNNPKMSPAFVKEFSVDETLITLEAGKEYNHKVTGPKDKVYDYQKFQMQDSAVSGIKTSDFQKYNKYTFGCITVDLAAAATGTGGRVGRITDVDGSTGFGLLVETTLFYRLAMPEQAGMFLQSAITAPASLPMSQRRGAYCIDVYPPTESAAPSMVLDETPGQAPVAGSF